MQIRKSSRQRRWESLPSLCLLERGLGRDKLEVPQGPPTHPVHHEGLAHAQPLLEKLGSDGHGVEVAEPPTGENQEKRRQTVGSD